MIVSGERLPGLLMTIIRFVLPLQDHMIKKLLLIFWEIVPKTTPDGKLMQEMILVCDSYRKVDSFYSRCETYVILEIFFHFVIEIVLKFTKWI
jgi:vesicle coat complex subunit